MMNTGSQGAIKSQCAAALGWRSRWHPRHGRSAHGRFISLVLAALALATGTSPTLAAAWTKLSSGASYSDVRQNFHVSPDGEWVVYWQDRDGDSVYELFSAPTSAAAPHRRISGLLPVGGTFPQWAAITPDSSTVVYVAEQDTFGKRELFAVPIEGGAFTKLNLALPVDHEVKDFAISPQGDRVLYSLRETSQSYDNLYVVPIGGGTSVKLNDDVDRVISYEWSSGGDGDRVVHLGWTPGDVQELYSGPADGSSMATKLNGAVVNGGDVWAFEISPAGDRVVYRGDIQTDDKVELYSVPIAGGGSAKLSHPTMQDTGQVNSFEINRQGTHVIYVVEELPNNLTDLWVSAITGGGANKVSQRRGTNDFVLSASFSPLGDRVGFLYYDWNIATSIGQVELYSTPISTVQRVKLSTDLEGNGTVYDFKWTPDGQWVVYQADPYDTLWRLLFRAPAAGPASDEAVSWNEVPFGLWEIDLERDRIVLAGTDPFLDTVVRPWQVPFSVPNPLGGAVELVDDSLFDLNGDVKAMKTASNGRVVYVADQDNNDEDELYVVLTDDIFTDGFEPDNDGAP